MGREDDIQYPGPGTTYAPGTGTNRDGLPIGGFKTPSQRSYADIDRLDMTLKSVIAEAKQFITDMDTELNTYVLPVPRGDGRLTAALRAEWPVGLGETKDHVSYRLYKYLEHRQTTSAAYLRERFEEGIRDYTGTHNLDLRIMMSIVADEATLIQEFRSTYIGNVDDPSEHRSVELFLDWADGARQRIKELKQLDQGMTNIKLPDADVSATTPDEARNAQAMFKVKLNSANRELGNTLQFLDRNYIDHAATFYGKFLGPALQFRLNVNRAIQPASGRLGVESTITSEAMDMNLKVALSDQLRRNTIFDTKMTQAVNQVTRQGVYRNYINQLADTGQTIVPGKPGTVAQVQEDPAEVAYFASSDTVVPPLTDIETLVAAHGGLTGLDDPSAHDQYLLKDGDTLTGDTSMALGVLIDGMRPGAHRHTGGDGTQKVHGSDIEGGSVGPGVIDRTVVPGTPTNLHLVSQTTRVVPPGVTVVDVVVGWDGDPTLQYELQSAPLE